MLFLIIYFILWLQFSVTWFALYNFYSRLNKVNKFVRSVSSLMITLYHKTFVYINSFVNVSLKNCPNFLEFGGFFVIKNATIFLETWLINKVNSKPLANRVVSSEYFVCVNGVYTTLIYISFYYYITFSIFKLFKIITILHKVSIFN